MVQELTALAKNSKIHACMFTYSLILTWEFKNGSETLTFLLGVDSLFSTDGLLRFWLSAAGTGEVLPWGDFATPVDI